MFYKSQNQSWETVDESIDRQIVGFDDHLMMVNVRFKKGGIGYAHQHLHSQATHVAEGMFEVSIAKQTSILSKGDSFFVPSNVVHGVVCLTDGLLIDVFSPKREDFLK